MTGLLFAAFLIQRDHPIGNILPIGRGTGIHFRGDEVFGRFRFRVIVCGIIRALVRILLRCLLRGLLLFLGILLGIGQFNYAIANILA